MHNVIQSGLTSSILLVGLVLMVQASDASQEVLSDMDCVVQPSAIVDLGSAVPGQLAKTRYDRGDFVQAGTVLGRLESGVEQVALAIAETAAISGTAIELRELSASFGVRTLKRNQSLLQSKSISAQTMDQMATEAAIADLQVRQEREGRDIAWLEVEHAREVLKRRVLFSPIDGSIMQRFKSAGEYVDSEPVFRIAQLNPLHVEVIVPMEYFNSLQTGMRAGVTIAAPGFEDEVLDAIVRRIDAVADAASATYGVLLVLENPDLAIPAGVRCSVDFFTS